MNDSLPDIHTAVFLGQDMTAPIRLGFAEAEVMVFSRCRRESDRVNQDAIALVWWGPQRGLIAVADGAGGMPAGGRAAALAVDELRSGLIRGLVAGNAVREGVLDGFEGANRSVLELGVGAATTLIAVEIDGEDVRTYHCGDSQALITGQRGRLRLLTASHSPVGYAVEAGLLNEDDALHHEARHVVSNMIGAADMRIEMGSQLKLGRRDTLVVGSDGLFDNLRTEEIVGCIRKGPLEAAASELANHAMARMDHPQEGEPSKPDDLTFVLYRSR